MNEMSILGVQANLIRFPECQGSCSPPFKQSHYLYSKMNQLYEYTYPLFWTSFPFRSPENTEESFLHYTVGPQSSILYTVSVVYICFF